MWAMRCGGCREGLSVSYVLYQPFFSRHALEINICYHYVSIGLDLSLTV